MSTRHEKSTTSTRRAYICSQNALCVVERVQFTFFCRESWSQGVLFSVMLFTLLLMLFPEWIVVLSETLAARSYWVKLAFCVSTFCILLVNAIHSILTAHLKTAGYDKE